MAPRLGLIVGGGDVPLRLHEACVADGRDLRVVAIEGHADPAYWADKSGVGWFRLGAGADILAFLKAESVDDLVLVGRVRRPTLAELRPDWKTAQLFAKAGVKALGDDGLLRAVVDTLGDEGFRVLGVQDLLADLLAPLGKIGSIGPGADASGDIAKGVRVARLLGAADVGQAVVVQHGLVLGVEAIEGTDGLIDRCALLRREGEGPVLVKVRKPQQDRRLDLPTIGPKTITRAAAAGFAGIAVEAGATLVLDRGRVAELADTAGLFVIGVEGSDVE